MKTMTFGLECITPCFCGGADPKQKAEIRASSIRGQLRWWFRTLGGFKTLTQTMNTSEQESLLFGSASGNEGTASRLIMRVRKQDGSSVIKSGKELGADNIDSANGYFLFPLRTQKDKETKQPIPQYRGVFTQKLPSFEIEVLWRGLCTPYAEEINLTEDISALISVFAHLGSLGFRSRRGFGALAGTSGIEPMNKALERFSKPEGVTIKTLGECERGSIQSMHYEWIKRVRTHGSNKYGLNSEGPNWNLVHQDHDVGIEIREQLIKTTKPVHRAALGLPIIQFFSSGHPEVNWYEEFDQQKARENRHYKGEGRFASPVLLRPHRDPEGKWHALVIFVDAHKWRENTKVYLNGQERAVSLDLYEATKKDRHLMSFPG